MALDRQSIEKKDFPVARRGYDPATVDAHLASLAQEMVEFERSTRRRPDTLSTAASDRVRSIVEAAEASAAEIQRDAESEARAVRDKADSEAQITREKAVEQAREYVDKVSQSTNHMMQRLDSFENELSALLDSLRMGANRLTADLQLLETNLGEVTGVGEADSGFELEPEDEPELAVGDEDGVEAVETLQAVDVDAGETGGVREQAGGAGEAGGAAERGTVGKSDPAAAVDDAEGARLVALNMALNGTTRDETWRYLLENFQLSDASGLLDEVYASVEG